MTRWLALALGLAIAGSALYLLGRGGEPRPVTPRAEIDEVSRGQLERVLEKADRKEGRR